MRKSIPIAAGLLLMSLLSAGCTQEERNVEPNPTVMPETRQNAAKNDQETIEAVSTSPNVQKITFHSESLNREMHFNIYLPIGYDESQKYPVLYMYHGYGSNEDAWMPDLGIDQAADELLTEGKVNPLIIVSPEINNSYGFNSSSEGNYSDYIIKDIIKYVDSHFSTDARRESRYIGGLSMGGWAALYNAFAHPELFSKVGGHSPAVWMNNWSDTGGLKDWIYPTEEIRKQRDPLLLAETADLQELAVYLDCGDEDGYKFYEGSEALYKKLSIHNVKAEYHLSKGGHDGEYWKSHMRDYLLFYSGN
ncbi:alpha/beta hydrolase [Paenibacillus sp. sgz500958]|uniref:alpha/beta hydrolase n=1 Tax=Paenibacillus sp. sgz500958 TaxID=3242475 RepID=UPI0036D29007